MERIYINMAPALVEFMIWQTAGVECVCVCVLETETGINKVITQINIKVLF